MQLKNHRILKGITSLVIFVMVNALGMNLHAQNIDYYAGLKSGGFAGRFAIGAGIELLKPHLDFSVWYGYSYYPDLKQSVNSAELMASYKLQILNFNDHGTLNFRLGASGVYYHSLNTFGKLPEKYPNGYYKPTAFHALGQAMISYRKPFTIEKSIIPIETGLGVTVPVGLGWNALVNHQPKLFEYSTLCVSLRIHVPQKASGTL